ncbi:MAG: GumC family protein [Acidobacteriota bacterium]
MERWESRPIHLIEYWQVVVKRRWLVYSAVLLVTGIVMLGSFLVRPRYTATAQIEIQNAEPQILPFEGVLSEIDSNKDFIGTQSRLIKSWRILKTVVRELDLKSRPGFKKFARLEDETLTDDQRDQLLAEELKEDLEVEVIRNSRLINISFEDTDRDLAAKVANNVAHAYFNFTVQTVYNTNEEASGSVAHQIEILRKEIEKKEREQQEYARKHDIVLIDDRQNVTSQKLRELTGAYTDAQKKRILAEARYVAMRDSLEGVLPELMNNEILLTLAAKEADLERRYASMGKRFKPDWPAMARLESELENTRVRLRKEKSSLYQRLLADTEERFFAARNEERALRRTLAAQKRRAQNLHVMAIEYKSREADIRSRRATLDAMLKREAETNATASMRGAPITNIRIVDRAHVPLEPSWPRKKMNLALSLLAGLGLGIGLAFFFDYLDDSVRDEEDLDRAAGLACLGMIPDLSRQGGERGLFRVRQGSTNGSCPEVDLTVLHKPHAPAAEVFREVRTELLVSSPGHPPRTLLVTSPGAAEGKTMMVLNLAAALTQINKKVLVVDSDLRRPRLLKALEMEASRGLSNVLSGELEPEEVMVPGACAGLFLLPSGPVPPNAAELLDSDQFRSLVKRIQGGFDHVIFDSPPVLVATDAIIMSPTMDAVVLVAKADRTTRHALARSADKLRRMNARVLGAIINAVDASHRDGYYHTYRYEPETSEKPMSKAAAGGMKLKS